MPACLIVASHFPPMRSAGVFRTLRIARYLPEHDWKLHVLTLNESAYLNGTTSSQELLSKIPDEVCIHRTSATHRLEQINAVKDWVRKGKRKESKKVEAKSSEGSSASAAKQQGTDRSFLQRVKDGITLPLMTPDRWIGWLPFAVRAGRQILKNHPIDVIYSSGPPWTNHLAALQLKQSKQTAWVADFRDPWLGNNFRPQRQGDTWVGRQHQTLERNVVEAADVVILNTKRSRQSMIDRYSSLPEDKFLVIPNGYDPADFEEIQKEHLCSETSVGQTPRPLRMVHAGAFYGRRNVDSLLQAIGELVCQKDLDSSDLQIDLIGAARPGRSRELQLAEAAGVSDIVNVLPSLPHAECLGQLLSADVLLLVQTEAPLCIPGKVFEYIALRKTVFTLAGEGSTADLVRSEHLGPCADPLDKEQIKSSVLGLVRNHQVESLPRPGSSALAKFDGCCQVELFDGALKKAMAQHKLAITDAMSADSP
ncbi:MAG: glycosyltransferase [Pirellulaceae bacterium]|nr:glycosyltransferase [Pirellulaceae bacterium]